MKNLYQKAKGLVAAAGLVSLVGGCAYTAISSDEDDKALKEYINKNTFPKYGKFMTVLNACKNEEVRCGLEPDYFKKIGPNCWKKIMDTCGGEYKDLKNKKSPNSIKVSEDKTLICVKRWGMEVKCIEF